MSNHNHQLTYNNLQQAASWFVALNDAQVATQDQDNWQQWLAACPSHQLAWQQVLAVNEKFTSFEQEADIAACSLQSARNQPLNIPISRRDALRFLSLSALAMSSWALFRYTPIKTITMAHFADYQSTTGEISDINLADNSTVWLNTASAFNVNYQADVRLINFIRGEILISTSNDSNTKHSNTKYSNDKYSNAQDKSTTNRPFKVATTQGMLQALGTNFSVREVLSGTAIEVHVFEGRVKITTASSKQQHIIATGQAARFTQQKITILMPAQSIRKTWHKKVLYAENITLAALITELSLYRHGYLGVSPAIANRKVVGAFPLDDTNLALSMIAKTLQVSIKQLTPWWVSLE